MNRCCHRRFSIEFFIDYRKDLSILANEFNQLFISVGINAAGKSAELARSFGLTDHLPSCSTNLPKSGEGLMKHGEDFDLDELLPDPDLFAFVLSSFHFFRGGGVLFWCLRVQKKKHPYERKLSSTITIKVESSEHI